MSFLEMSLSGGAMILAAALIRALGRDRLPQGAFMALWALAVARLTVPVRLPFRFSALALLRRAVPHTAGPGPIPAAIALPGQAAAHTVDIIQNMLLPDKGAPFPTVTVLWLAGALICGLVFAISYIRARRAFRPTAAVTDGPAAAWLAAHPLRRRVSLRRSDKISAPLTYGVLRPVILLPPAMDGADEQTVSYVLAHEMAHIRRFDGSAKLILAATACLHWFNPLVWLMLTLAGRDMEICCDQAVVRPLDSEARKAYARALLDMEERRGGFAAASSFSRNAIEERIHSIMRIRKKSFLSALLALVLVLTVGAVFATAAPEPENDAVPGVFSGDVITTSDGTVYVFTEDGEPVTMTQEEYKILTDPVEVEWWTAEEYAAWLEQEKKDLQDCLGERAWTNSDGWFTWTQEKIDETIEMYEHILKEIEDGLLVSKNVDDSGDVILAQGDGWDVRFMTEDEAIQPIPGDDGTATVPPNIVFIERADGAPVFYELIESGGRMKVADGLYAAPGNLITVGLQTRTDAVLTVSLHGDANHMGQSVDLKAGELQTITFYPSQTDEYDLYLTNNSGSPVEFDVSWALS